MKTAGVGQAAGYSRGIVTITSEAATFERRDGLFRGCWKEADGSIRAGVGAAATAGGAGRVGRPNPAHRRRV